jgi:hypothetical protein
VRLDPVYGCWLHLGRKNEQGYGLTPDGKLAHRETWIAIKGPIPPGMELDHGCRRRLCRRPEHLEPVSRSENERRKSFRRRMRRTTCKAGHRLYEHGRRTPEGGKVCLLCAPLESK